MKATKSQIEKAAALGIVPGATLYTILRHVSRSGMKREIGVVVFRADQPLHPNSLCAELTGRKVSKDRDGVVVHGAGMDMGFELIYSLSYALFGDGYALKQRCL